jgi:hypothetical protein
MAVNKTVIEGNFGIVPNDIWPDRGLKHADVRVYGYIRSKPPGWNVNNSDVCKSLGMAESTLTASWGRLQASGWMSRERLRNKAGAYTGGYSYTLHASPNPCFTQIRVTARSGQNIEHSKKEFNTKKENPSPKKRNLWFDAVAKCQGFDDKVPKSMASAIASVARDLKGMGVKPEDIPVRYAEGCRRFDNFTPMGLVKWWNKLESDAKETTSSDIPEGL